MICELYLDKAVIVKYIYKEAFKCIKRNYFEIKKYTWDGQSANTSRALNLVLSLLTVQTRPTGIFSKKKHKIVF